MEELLLERGTSVAMYGMVTMGEVARGSKEAARLAVLLRWLLLSETWSGKFTAEATGGVYVR